MELRGVLETSVYADDLAAAERFYTSVLGLEVIARQEGRHVFFRSGRGVFLVFNPDSTETPHNTPNFPALPTHGARGPGHMAFRVNEAELPAWRERLKRAGVAVEAEIAWPQGGHSVYFRDPAGNSIEIATPALWGLPEDV